jgi:hypothetical protein
MLAYKKKLQDLANNGTEELNLFREYMDDAGDDPHFENWLDEKIACRDGECGHCDCNACDCCVCDQGRCSCEICDECEEHDSCSCEEPEEVEVVSSEKETPVTPPVKAEEEEVKVRVERVIIVWDEEKGREITRYNVTTWSRSHLESHVADCGREWPKAKILRENC